MSLPDSSSSSSPPVTREETGYIRFEHGSQDNGFDHRDRPPWNRSEYDYRHGSIVASENPRNSSTSSEDPWSCVVVVATFCVFGDFFIFSINLPCLRVCVLIVDFMCVYYPQCR